MNDNQTVDAGDRFDQGPPRPFDEFDRTTWPRVPGYTLTGFIGGGGQSLVFATDKVVTERPVAVKVPRPGLFGERGHRRLREEDHMLCDLPEHPGLAKVYYSHVCDGPALWKGVPFIAMELVKGVTLDKFLRPSNPRPSPTIRDRLAIFQKICSAVHAVHSKIVHCDLKPENIVVEPGGNPKIIDFGVARRIAGEEPAADLFGPERVGIIGGTPVYMSPEQVARFIDPRRASDLLTQRDRDALALIRAESDIYSLGVILFEMVTARRPFLALERDPSKHSRAVLKEPAPRPTIPLTVGSSTPAAGKQNEREATPDRPTDLFLRHIILRALRKHPARRHRTASAFARALGLYRALAAPFLAFRGSGRALTAVLIALVVVHLGLFVGVPLVTSWTDASLKYQQWLASPNMPARRATASLDHVRMLVFDDATDFAALSAKEPVRLANVVNGPDYAYTRRAMYGWLLKKFAEEGVRAKAIAFDLYFPAHPDAVSFDAVLAEGVQAMSLVGVPTVVGLEDWPRDGLPEGAVCDSLRDKVFFGGITMDQREGMLPWHVHAALKPHTRANVLPGLSLAAVALASAPEWLYDISADLRTGAIELRFERLRQTPSVPVNRGPPPVRRIASHVNDLGIDAAGALDRDSTLSVQIDLPSDAELEAATVTIQQAASADPAQLREWFDGRVVVIGNMRSDAVDQFPYVNRPGTYHGCIGHTVAINSMLSGSFFRMLSPVALRFSLFAAGLTGALAVLVLARRRIPLVLSAVLAALALWTAAVFACYYGGDLLLDPSLQGFGVIAGAALAWLVAPQLDAVLLLRERVA